MLNCTRGSETCAEPRLTIMDASIQASKVEAELGGSCAVSPLEVAETRELGTLDQTDSGYTHLLLWTQ